MVFLVTVCVPVIGLRDSFVVTLALWRPRRRDMRDGFAVVERVVRAIVLVWKRLMWKWLLWW